MSTGPSTISHCCPRAGALGYLEQFGPILAPEEVQMCEDVLCPALPWAAANTFTHLQPSFAQGLESSVRKQLDIDTA